MNKHGYTVLTLTDHAIFGINSNRVTTGLRRAWYR